MLFGTSLVGIFQRDYVIKLVLGGNIFSFFHEVLRLKYFKLKTWNVGMFFCNVDKKPCYISIFKNSSSSNVKLWMKGFVRVVRLKLFMKDKWTNLPILNVKETVCHSQYFTRIILFYYQVVYCLVRAAVAAIIKWNRLTVWLGFLYSYDGPHQGKQLNLWLPADNHRLHNHLWN